MRWLLITFFLFLIPGFGHAADWDADSSDVLNIKYGFVSSNLTLDTQFTVKPSNGVEVKYAPNTTSSSFLAFGYRNLGISLGSPNPQTPESISVFGKTTGQDYQIKLFGKRMTHEFTYQKYSGYFISNSGDVDSAYSNNGKYIQRSDISTEKYGLNLIYNFQPEKFSLNAAFSQGAVQDSTSGSWLGVIVLQNNQFTSLPQLIPTTVSNPYGSYGNVMSGKSFTSGAGVGYGVSLVGKGFYAALQFIVGWSSQQQSLTHATGVAKSSTESSNFSNVKLGVGYNGKKNYIGFSFLSDASNYKTPDDVFKISGASTNVSLFYGHRFGGVNLVPFNGVSSLFD